MPRLQSVKDTRWAFYEAMPDDPDEMASAFETLYLHYQARGRAARKVWSTNNGNLH